MGFFLENFPSSDVTEHKSAFLSIFQTIGKKLIFLKKPKKNLSNLYKSVKNLNY